MELSQQGQLFLIDGTFYCYRAFYAIKELSTSKGQPTNAVYGFIAMIKKLMEEEKPDYLAVAFDMAAPTFRHRRYEAYKKHRPPMPEALSAQIPVIKEVLRAFRIPILEREGYEADDLLGTFSVRAAKVGLTVMLVTEDKDALQLLGPRVKIYRTTRDGVEIIDAHALSEKWRIRPDQVVDVMALMGDEVDAIPGVPGIGEKTAVELVQRFGSVEELLAHLDQVPGASRRIVLENHQDQLRLSRELVVLDTRVPLEVELEDLKRREPDGVRLRQLFQELEFRTLLKELVPETRRAELKVRRIDSAEQMSRLIPEVRQAGSFALCVAVAVGGKPGRKSDDGPRPMESAVLGVALCWGSGSAVVVTEPSLLGSLDELWKDSGLTKICPDLKETLILFRRQGLWLGEPWADPTLASYLLDPGRPSHRIEALSSEWLGESVEDPDPFQTAALSANAAWRLMSRLEQEIQEKQLATLLHQVEIPLARVLADMEFTGIAIDPAELESLAKEMSGALEILTRQIQAQAGEPFNLNSPKQMAQILFEKLKLPVLKRTKTGASTNEEVLRRLSLQHELPAKILEYREMHKLQSTYVEALPKLIHPETHRIHTSLKQTVTATGRLSSSDPNLQNIPIRTELGRQIRRAFLPSRRDRLFLTADYSQIELRILAHLSGDARLCEAFRKEKDIHRVTAAQVFRVETESVTNEQRAAAKTINFGIVYGMTPYGLSKELGISPEEAQDFIESYFAQYPGVREYLNRSLEETRARGYCMTILNRRRTIPELSSKEMMVRQFAERMAINAPIQGSAADLIKVAMVAVDEAIQAKSLASQMLLQVHDELIFEVPEPELEAMRDLVQGIMEAPALLGSPIRLSVPIRVNVKTGRNWLEASHA